MSDERPDPDAIYEAVTGFATWRVKDVNGNPTTVATGWRAFGSDPVVIAHFNDHADPKFRLAPVDSNRRASRDREPAPVGQAADAEMASTARPEDRFGLIEKSYNRLKSVPPGINEVTFRSFKRQRRDQPSRPEVAHDIGVSPKTVNRWAWPPAGARNGRPQEFDHHDQQ